MEPLRDAIALRDQGVGVFHPPDPEIDHPNLRSRFGLKVEYVTDNVYGVLRARSPERGWALARDVSEFIKGLPPAHGAARGFLVSEDDIADAIPFECPMPPRPWEKEDGLEVPIRITSPVHGSILASFDPSVTIEGEVSDPTLSYVSTAGGKVPVIDGRFTYRTSFRSASRVVRVRISVPRERPPRTPYRYDQIVVCREAPPDDDLPRDQ